MRLFIACVITVVMESALFWIFGYRKKEDLMIVALANVITNLTLNLIIALVPVAYEQFLVICLEVVVIAAEFLIYKRAFGGSAELMALTAAANLITYTTGLVLTAFDVL